MAKLGLLRKDHSLIENCFCNIWNNLGNFLFQYLVTLPALTLCDFLLSVRSFLLPFETSAEYGEAESDRHSVIVIACSFELLSRNVLIKIFESQMIGAATLCLWHCVSDNLSVTSCLWHLVCDILTWTLHNMNNLYINYIAYVSNIRYRYVDDNKWI